MAVMDRSTGLDERTDLETLYRGSGARMWRSVLAFAGDPEVASDAVAEAFCQALRRGDAIRDPERWIWRAAFRIASGYLAELRRTVETIREEAYEMEEPARELVAALQRLSRTQRAAVVLHYVEGYPANEIAELVGSTPAAVRVHLMRARRRLRRLLKEDADV
jgi:RNA polymerase sigma-70 factor (ECF subfamily)